MDNLQIERKKRMIYQQQEKEKEENRKKYPAIYNQINDNNIKNYFEFNELNEEIKSNYLSSSTSFLSENENNKNINYDNISYLDNELIPDLYTPYGKISGDNYKLIDIVPNKINLEDIINYKSISKKRLRYFDLDQEKPEIIISILPKNNDKKKKKKKFYNNNNKSPNFCYICLSKEHFTKEECPRYKRCIKCLKYGHRVNNCKEIIKNKCENCNISCHSKEDCLKFQDELKFEDLFLKKNKGLKCFICGQKSHLICPFSMREKFVLNINKKNTDDTKDYSNILFCPFCAGNHLKTECPEIQKKNNFNDNIMNKEKISTNLIDNKKSKDIKEQKEKYNIKINKENNNNEIRGYYNKINNYIPINEEQQYNNNSNNNTCKYRKNYYYGNKKNNNNKYGGIYKYYKRYKNRIMST